jgi:DNA-binding CsgD family transcriptional regulator
MGLRKGRSIINLQAFLAERIGSDAWDRLSAAVSEEDRRVLSNVVPSGWYDIAFHARLNRAFCDVFFDGSLAAAEELGRFSADKDFELTPRWMLRLVDPSFAIKHMDIYWKEDEDTGSWKTVTQGDHVITELLDWDNVEPVLCRRLLGYIGRTLERAGAVFKKKHTNCRGLGDPSCVFEFDWHIEPDAPAAKGALTSSMISEIGRELCGLPDLESLVQAIVNLAHVRLGYPYIELWVHWPDSSELALFKTSGVKTGSAPLHFVLQKATRTVGRITIEGPQGKTSKVSVDLLDDLLPWITLTLDAALMSSNQSTPITSFTRRLMIAQMRWNLTPRQMEVLELVLRGMSNKEIAAVLQCESGNVEQHITHIKRHAGAEKTNRAGLAWKFWMEL